MTGVEGGRGGAAATRSWADLRPRMLSAVAMAAAAVGTAWAGGLLFDYFWMAAGAIVFSEWIELTGAERVDRVKLIGVVVLGVAAAGVNLKEHWPAVAALACGILLIFAVAPPRHRAITGLGLAYAGILAAALPLLRHSGRDGLGIVLWLFAVVWGTDTMAFFGGRAIGGPRLAPRLSPSKTWSGFGIGVVSGAVLGLLVAPRSGCPLCVFAAGLAGGAVAQAGDLFESALKRRFGVKDAGSLIPGHGGVMDRLDGFIAATFLAAVVGLWRFGPDGAGAGMLQW